jgi:hypothetical protein
MNHLVFDAKNNSYPLVSQGMAVTINKSVLKTAYSGVFSAPQFSHVLKVNP